MTAYTVLLDDVALTGRQLHARRDPDGCVYLIITDSDTTTALTFGADAIDFDNLVAVMNGEV